MTCYYPIDAFQEKPGDKPVFKIPPNRLSFNLKLPCRQCIGCRIAKEVEWSVRMMHEASLHDGNEFITLTYDPEHVPHSNSLDHTHFQKFIRALRKKTKQKLRYYVAGEYGDEKSRPHFHSIIFGLELDDLVQIGPKNYRSETITNAWGLGHCDIGENVTRASCCYTAGYLLKDTNKEWKNNYEWPNLITGEVQPRKRPYAKMSNRPGIGKKWYDQFSSDVFPDDFIVMDGRQYPTPAYYRRLLERENPELFEELKQKREEALHSEQFKKNNTPERLAAREKFVLSTVGDKEARSNRKTPASIGAGKFKNKPGATAADLTEQSK